MCGRYTLTQISPELIRKLFLLTYLPDLRPRYNIAPTQHVLVVREKPDNERGADFVRWGLIPSWAKEEAIGNRMINLRSETVADKPGFRGPFRHRRCLVVADGFYEWQKAGPRKQPVYVRRADGQPFGFGGVWDHWISPDAAEIESCSIITTAPSEFIAPIHDRMPLIIEPGDYDLWLDPAVQRPDDVRGLLKPYTSPDLTAYPVSTLVNSADNDDPACIEPLGTPC